MSNVFVRQMTRRSLATIRHVSPVLPDAARGLVASVYAQADRDFGMLAPPIALHSPAPAPLAALWIMLRETLLVPGSAGRPAKEATAAAVSAGNACPYCVTIHGAVLRGLADGPVPALITAGQIESIADPGLRELARWARGSGLEEQAGLHGEHLPAGQFPEIAGVAVTFHYLNRMVNVFLGESPLPPSAPRMVTGPMMRVLASILLSSGRRGLVPGAALDLLPPAELPADMAWAAGEPRIAAALARAAAAIGAGAEQVVPPAVRELVLGTVSRWNGQAPGPSRAWADDAVTGLATAHRAAGRLALLTALGSYQVLPRDIEDFRAHQPGDDALITLTSWASMAAARRISSWLRQPARVSPSSRSCASRRA